MKKATVDWFHMGSWGVFVGYAPNQEAFDACLKRLKIKCNMPLISEGAGGTTHVLRNPAGELCMVIGINVENARTPITLAGIVVHEVSHVVQFIWEDIAERQPGHEAQAYLFQYLTIMILEAIDKHKRKADVEVGRRLEP